jgi:hypothetical protein
MEPVPQKLHGVQLTPILYCGSEIQVMRNNAKNNINYTNVSCFTIKGYFMIEVT